MTSRQPDPLVAWPRVWPALAAGVAVALARAFPGWTWPFGFLAAAASLLCVYHCICWSMSEEE